MRFLISGSSLDSGDDKADHRATLFYLEIITRITIANKDRWETLKRLIIKFGKGDDI